MAKKAIIDMTDDEIDEELRSGVGHLIYLTNDFLAERDRRAARRQADSTQRIARIALAASIASALAAGISAIAAVVRGS